MSYYKPSETEIEHVITLPANKRYEYFIKKITDWEQAWGLYQEGWALASTNDTTTVFPLWPAQEYAALCAHGSWAEYTPTLIELDDLLEGLLPALKEDDVAAGVFYTPQDTGVIREPDQLKKDLEDECSKYE